MAQGEGDTDTGAEAGAGPVNPVDDADGAEGVGGGGRAERRRRVPGGRRHKHTVRFTDREQQLVQAAAEAAGVSVPYLIAETVLLALRGGGRLSVADQRVLAGQLAAVRRSLKAIGTNVNQVATVANATGHLPPHTEATMHALARMLTRLDTAIPPRRPR